MRYITSEEFQQVQAMVSAEVPELSRTEQDMLTLFWVSLIEEQRAEQQQQQQRRAKKRRNRRAA